MIDPTGRPTRYQLGRCLSNGWTRCRPTAES